ncbi:MAG: murein biosynthesis integral membrane protein MurJ [Patescibacteria group bacterium]|nr:murein biosynthesis integral membrane protein MurJ [Patescibacteria group bacterium]MCL5431975.1 murein biosynthesis integral membrane protein MurJ [Patescibacteria group bacterium]
MKDLLFRRQTSILSAATLIAMAVLGAKFLGIIRYWLLTVYVRPVSDLDIFFAAFRIPDFIFQILVMGTLTTAFIPVIAAYVGRGQDHKAWRVSSIIVNLALIVFAVLAVIAFIFAKDLAIIVAPGFAAQPDKLDKLANLSRIMLSAQVFFVISNFFSAIIQSTKRFLIPALAPAAYNTGIIIGIIFLAPVLGIYGPAWGVVLGIFLHFLIQLPLVAHMGFKYEPIIDLKDHGVAEVAKLLGPRTFGLAISQISFTVDTAMASLLATSSITILNLSQALQQVPIALFGATIAQAALPTLSEEQARENLDNFKKTLLTSFHQILFLTMPASAILIVLRIPVVRLAFGLGNNNFPWDLTVLTGKTLAVFGLGIFTQSLINLLVRAFYALRDSLTPVKIGVASFVVSIILSLAFILVFRLPVWALAASSAAGDAINFFFLMIFLDRVLHFDRKQVLLPAGKIFLAAAITGLALYVPMKLLDQLVFDTTKTLPLIALTGAAGASGISVYLFLTWLLGIGELQSFLGLFGKLRHLRKPPEVTAPVTEIVETTETHA